MHSKIAQAVPKSIWLFTAIWFVLNLLQAHYTELIGDEAYYWYYSLHLSWAYFDHPPMIALFVWLGHHLLPGPLGVRWVTVLSGALCIPLLWRLVDEPAPDRRKTGLFIAIVSSAVLFNAFSFIATPDSPLLFFSLVFYLAYRQFLRERGLWPILGLGLSMALLLYSKYHAVLVIGFALLSNWRILLTRRFLAAAALTVLLCLPHLAAGLQVGFPSISYNLWDRVSPHPYRWRDTVSQLLNQFLILGPFMAFPLLRAVFRYPRREGMDAVMQFTFFGVFSFFLLVSFQRRVEAHWMAPMTLPLLYLGYRFFAQPHRGAKWLYRLYLPTILCLLLARLVVVTDFLPLGLEFSGRKTWIPAVRQRAKGLPVIFENTYAGAAKYGFYTGKPTYSFDNIRYRQNQYDLGDGETRFWGQKIFYVLQDSSQAARRVGYTPFAVGGTKRPWYYKVYPNFHSAQKLRLRLDRMPKVFPPGRPVTLKARIYNPYDRPIRFDRKAMPIGLWAYWSKRTAPAARLRQRHPRALRRRVKIIPPIAQIGPKRTREVQLQFQPPEEEGDYSLQFPFSFGDLPGGFNSRTFQVELR